MGIIINYTILILIWICCLYSNGIAMSSMDHIASTEKEKFDQVVNFWNDPKKKTIYSTLPGNEIKCNDDIGLKFYDVMHFVLG